MMPNSPQTNKSMLKIVKTALRLYAPFLAPPSLAYWRPLKKRPPLGFPGCAPVDRRWNVLASMSAAIPKNDYSWGCTGTHWAAPILAILIKNCSNLCGKGPFSDMWRWHVVLKERYGFNYITRRYGNLLNEQRDVVLELLTGTSVQRR